MSGKVRCLLRLKGVENYFFFNSVKVSNLRLSLKAGTQVRDFMTASRSHA